MLQMKPGSMNLLHNASIGMCSHKNPESLENASIKIRKYEKTTEETRMLSESNYDIFNASLASIALYSMTGKKNETLQNPRGMEIL